MNGAYHYLDLEVSLQPLAMRLGSFLVKITRIFFTSVFGFDRQFVTEVETPKQQVTRTSHHVTSIRSLIGYSFELANQKTSRQSERMLTWAPNLTTWVNACCRKCSAEKSSIHNCLHPGPMIVVSLI